MTRKLTITTILLLLSVSLRAQVPTPQDCLGAIPVCQTVIYEAVPGTSEGNYTNEIDPSNSCVSGEDNSIWYTFTANTNGNLNFVITPDDPDDDYDWILFDITNAGCEDLFNDPSLIVSCNAAGGPGCHGPTGATGASPYTDQGGGCGSPAPSQAAGFSPFNDEIPMTLGNTYVLMVSNWTGSNNGYTLDFSASTGIGIFDTTPPVIESVTFPTTCEGTTFEVEFSEYIQCSTIDDLNFQLNGPGGPYTVSLVGDACIQGGNQENFFTVTVSPFLEPNANFTFDLVADGSTEVLDLCGNPAAPVSFNFSTNFSLDNAPLVIPATITACVGENVTINPLSINSTPSPNFNFYSDAALTNILTSGPQYSFTANTNTTIYITEFLGGCESPPFVVDIQVSDLPGAPMATDPPPICAGDPDPTFMATGSGGTLLWYDSDPAIGNPNPIGSGSNFSPNINTNNIGTYNFWVAESIGMNCEGPATMITLEILDSPAEPTGTTLYEICTNDPAPALTVSGAGGIINWYDSDPTAGLPITIGTGSPFTPPLNTSTAGSFSFWVTESLSTNCESTPLEVVVQINPGPEFVDIQLNCAADLQSYIADINFSNADNLTANSGTVTNNGGGSFTISGIDVNTDLSVTVTNSANGCTLMQDFTAPDCSCPDITPPASNGDIAICDGEPIPTLSVTAGPGETVDWYDAATGGTLLAGGTTSFTPPGPGTYYAESRVAVNGCVSPRTAVSVIVNPLPSLGSFTADCAPNLLSYVVTVTINDGNSITVNSGSVINNGGGSFTISNIDVNTDLMITATDASGFCSSDLTIPAPDCSCPDVNPPVSNGDFVICDGDPIPALSVSVGPGETVDWYSAATGGSLLVQGSTTFTPPGAGTYFAETRVIVNGCVSATRTSVSLTINPLPEIFDAQIDCAPDLASYMVVIQIGYADNLMSSSGNVTNSGGGTFIIDQIPVNTNISVLATNSSTGCFTSFDFNAPDCSCPFVDPPVSNGDVSVCDGDPIPDLMVNVGAGETTDWYDAAAGGNLLAQGTTSFTPSGPGTYYVETRVVVNGCVSTRIAINFAINPLPALTDAQSDCSVDLMTYTITLVVVDTDILQASGGTVTNNGGGSYTISDIDINSNISVLASTNAGCFSSFDFTAPDCDCPDIDVPVSDGDIAICEGDPLPALSVSVGVGETVDWYDALTGGTLLLSGSDTYTPTAAGTYYAETRETGTGCISNGRTAVTLTVNPLPALVDAIPDCSADLLTYSVEVTITDADMITASSGTVTHNGGGSFTVSDIPNNTDITIQATSSSTGCMDSFDITAPICGCGTVNAPVSDGDVSICDDESIPALSVMVGAGETVDWYDADTGGNLLLADSPAYTPAMAGTYYAETRETGTGCISDTRTAVTLSINPIPVLDDVQTDCAPDLLTYSVTVNLTNADSVMSGVGAVTDNGGGSFTISDIDVNNDLTFTASNTTTGCSEDFTITAPNCNCPVISPPVSNGNIAICDGDTFPSLSATVGAGETIDWYDAVTGGTLLLADSPTYTPMGAGTYFAETREVSTDCVSDTRTAVTLTIDPLPVLNSSQTICSADLLTYTVNLMLTEADNIVVSEGTITDNGGGSFTVSGVDINNDLVVTGQNSLTSCEDNFTITAPDCNCPSIDPPVSSGDVSICDGDAIPAFNMTVNAGEAVDWYDAAVGGTLLLADSPSYTPADPGTYYAEAREVNSGCISATRTPVSFTINPLPTITDSMATCAADLLSYTVLVTFADVDNIIAGEGTVTDNGGGSYTISGIDPANNLVILALNTVTGCNDNFIIMAPDCSCPDVDAPVSDGDQAICDGDVIPALGATVDAGATIDWYDAVMGGNLLLADSPVYTPVGAGTYYAETRVVVNNCVSDIRTAVTLTINPLPTLTDSQADCAPDLQSYAVTVTLADADGVVASEGTVTDNGSGSFTISGIDPANDLMLTASNSATSCSADFTITAPDCSCPMVDAPVSNGDLAYCADETIPELSVTVNAGETVDWYDAAVGGNLLLNGSVTYTPAAAGTYYAETRVEINGCLSASRTAVTLILNPLPTLTASQADCAIDLQTYTVTVSLMDADGISVSDGVVTDNGGGSFTIMGVSPTADLVITATNSVTGCNDEFIITAPDCSCPAVNAPVSDGDMTICEGEAIPALSVTLGSGETVDWYDAPTGGTLLLSDATAYTPSGAGTYYAETRVVVNGCLSALRTPVTLTINPLPALSDSQTDCAPDLLTYTVTVMFTDADDISTSDGIITDNGGGAFTVSDIDVNNDLMITANNTATACSDDFTIAAPDCSCPFVDAPVSGGDLAICAGESIPTLSVSVNAGETVDWYDAGSGGTLLVADNVNYTPLAGGTYYAETRDLTNACTSDIRTAVTLTINDLPDLAVAEAIDPGCGLDNGSVTLEAVGGQSPFLYQIDGQGFVNTAIFNDLAAGTYDFTIQDNNGCQGTIDTTIFAPTGVTAVANVTDTLTCAVTSVEIDGNSTTSDGSVTYEWTFEGEVVSNEITAQALAPGMYILMAFQDACASIDTIEVAQNLSPGLEAVLNTENQLDCNITNALLDGTSSSVGSEISYTWFMDGNIISGADQSVYDASAAGTYFLLVTDNHTGCVVADTLELINNENYPVANAGSDGTLTCIVTNILADGSGSQSGDEIVYQWFDPAGNLISGGTTDTLTLFSPGIYSLMVTDTTNGCSNTDEMLVDTDYTPPVANAGDQMQLDCNETTLELNGQGSSVGDQYTYAWTTDVPGTGFVLSGNTSLAPTIGGPGNYYLLVTNNDNGCTSTDATFVTQVTTILTDFNVVSADAGCFGEANGFITIAAENPALQILYAFNDQPFTSNAQYSGLTAGSYLLTAEDASGCQWDTTVVIQEGIELELDLGEDIFISLGDSVQLQPQINFPEQTIASLNWSNRDLLGCPDCFAPMTQMLTNSTTFQLDLVDDNGCAVSDDITIFVDKERRVFIPNVFSPNSDGVNDIFVINSGNDVVEVKSFIIANRWGEVVFEQFNFVANDASFGWDGRFRGAYLNPGVFVYVAEIAFMDGETEIYSGDVILMR